MAVGSKGWVKLTFRDRGLYLCTTREEEGRQPRKENVSSNDVAIEPELCLRTLLPPSLSPEPVVRPRIEPGFRFAAEGMACQAGTYECEWLGNWNQRRQRRQPTHPRTHRVPPFLHRVQDQSKGSGGNESEEDVKSPSKPQFMAP